MPGTLYTFKSASHYGKVTISTQLKDNMVAFFNWGFLEIGAFTNVVIPNTTIRGGTPLYRLRPVVDRNFTNGRVWESAKTNWVYESGLSYGVQPIYVSGVYVDGNFKAINSSGTYAHVVDYPNGRIIFSNPIPTGSVVTCEYSYKRIKVTDIDDPLFRTAQDRVFYGVNDTNLMANSGEWARPAYSRVQLPMVAVEMTANIDASPKQIGGGQFRYQTVAFHIMAETAEERNKIGDIITSEKERTLLLFDVNRIMTNNAAPLTASGSLNPNGVNNYRNMLLPQASGGFQWKLCNFEDSAMRQIATRDPSLYYGLAELRLKTDMPEL
jgi:hypothetical protein